MALMFVLLMFLLGSAVPIWALSGKEFIELCRSGTPQTVAAAIMKGAELNPQNQHIMPPLLWVARDNPNPRVVSYSDRKSVV